MEVRALSFSNECQSMRLCLPVDNHHASIPSTGNRYPIGPGTASVSGGPPYPRTLHPTE